MTKEQYEVYLKSRRWQLVRSVRVALDGGRCHACMIADGERDSTGRKRHIEVHHRDYRWCNRGWLNGILNEIADTFVYCNVCHEEIHRANRLSDFLDMRKGPVRISVTMLVFVLLIILGMVQALYGWLAVLLAILASAYMLMITLFFYRS